MSQRMWGDLQTLWDFSEALAELQGLRQLVEGRPDHTVSEAGKDGCPHSLDKHLFDILNLIKFLEEKNCKI